MRLQTARDAVQIVKLTLFNHSIGEILPTLEYEGGWHRACVGTGYEDVNNDGRGDCGVYAGNPLMSETPEFNELISRNAKLSANPNYPSITSSGFDQYGPFVSYPWFGDHNRLVVERSLAGERQPCGLSPLACAASGGQVTMTPTSTPLWSKSGNGTTECIVVVENV